MKRRWFIARGLGGGLVTASVVLWGNAPARGAGRQTSLNPANSDQIIPTITVFRSPNCGCCGKWVEHMEAAGFQVQDTVTDDMTAIKEQYGVPADLASCHTALVDGYVVEGHVPAADVQRLLAERPDVVGIVTPGMPMGSPGMESGNRVDPYTVLSFTATGETATFAEHR